MDCCKLARGSLVQILRVLQDYQFHRVETVFHQGKFQSQSNDLNPSQDVFLNLTNETATVRQKSRRSVNCGRHVTWTNHPNIDGDVTLRWQSTSTHHKNRQPPRNTRSKSNRASVGRAGTSQIHGGPQPSTYRTHRIHKKHPGARHNRKPTDLRRFGKCWQITYSVKMPRYHANTSPSSYKLNPSPSSKDNKKWISFSKNCWLNHSYPEPGEQGQSSKSSRLKNF